MAAKSRRARPSVGIDTVPLPEIRIPESLAKEFGKDLRIVVRHPWVTGIPVPERFLTKELRAAMGKDFELIMTVKQR